MPALASNNQAEQVGGGQGMDKNTGGRGQIFRPTEALLTPSLLMSSRSILFLRALTEFKFQILSLNKGMLHEA